MSNLRVIYDNAADRATLSSSATAGSLGVSNLVTDIKSAVCRSTTTSLTITATWPTAETLGAAVFAFTNCTDNATITVSAYTLQGDSTPVYTDTFVASRGAVTNSRGVNNFAYGGGVYARAWFAQKVTVQKLVITLSDPNNPQGYVEAGRLIVGDYWLPSFGVEQANTSMTVNDSSTQTRTHAGDMYVTVLPRYKKMSLSMPSLDKTDRVPLWSILYNNGMVKPVFVSVFPNNSDPNMEHANQMYGRLSTSPSMQSPYYDYLAAKLDVEEI